MNPKKLINSFMFCQDLIKVFTEYSKKLDNYFNNPENIYQHNDLYDYYLDLKNQLQEISIKNGMVKKK